MKRQVKQSTHLSILKVSSDRVQREIETRLREVREQQKDVNVESWGIAR